MSFFTRNLLPDQRALRVSQEVGFGVNRVKLFMIG